MKTTVFMISLFLSITSLAQTTVSQSPTPPVPGQPDSVQDTTGAIVKDQNAIATEGSKGTIKRARVYFIEPKNGATVPTKFKVKMGVDGYKIRPAGEAPDEVTSGHHHIIVDGKPAEAGVPLPMNEKNIHYGKGQTEAELQLPPGQHQLTLQFADGAHRSFGPKMSQTIKVIVK